MKTILVPTDFSEEARKTFFYAIEMAKEMNLEILLFHAFHQPIAFEQADNTSEAILVLEKQIESLLEQWLVEAKNDLSKDFCWQFKSTKGDALTDQDTLTHTRSGLHTIEIPSELGNMPTISCVCKFGLASGEINKAVEAYHVDLVVMSSRGAGAFQQAFLGSTVAEVISSCQVPVLTLPKQGKFKKFKTLTFAANLNVPLDHIPLEFLHSMVKAFEANLQVLYFYTDRDQPLEVETTVQRFDALDIHLPDIDFAVHFKHCENIIAGINEYVLRQESDLLLFAPGKHNFMDILLNRSITEKIIEDAAVSFIALPNSLNVVMPDYRNEQASPSP